MREEKLKKKLALCRDLIANQRHVLAAADRDVEALTAENQALRQEVRRLEAKLREQSRPAGDMLRPSPFPDSGLELIGWCFLNKAGSGFSERGLAAMLSFLATQAQGEGAAH